MQFLASLMDPVSAFPALVVIFLAMAVCLLIMRRCGSPPHAGRFASIDGLRGFLALFVFLSHACLWYFYLHNGRWVVPPSRLYTHMGQGSVAVFFMITAFLFFSKLMGARYEGVDWARLFVSRLLRLGPLYLCTMLLMFAIIIGLTGGVLREPAPLLLKHSVEWLIFSIVGGPDVNGLKGTSVITAGVTWSLPYECAFYGSLPLLALCLRLLPPFRYLLLAVLTAIGFAALRPNGFYLFAFGGGIASALLARSPHFGRLASTTAASWLIVGCTAAAVGLYPTVQNPYALLFLSLAFALIACGNTLFGVLVHPLSRTLGAMAYSLYLLHGIALFSAFNFLVGMNASRQLSPAGYWWVVIAMTPLLITISYASYRLVEYPAMQRTDQVMAWLRRGSVQQVRIKPAGNAVRGLRGLRGR